MAYSTTSFDPGIESTEETLDQAENLLERAKTRGSEAVEDTKDLIRRHPAQALATSVLLGAAVGAILFRSLSSEPDFSERFSEKGVDTWEKIREGTEQALKTAREAIDVLSKKFK